MLPHLYNFFNIINCTEKHNNGKTGWCAAHSHSCYNCITWTLFCLCIHWFLFFTLQPLLFSKRMDLAHGARDNQSYISFILNQKFRNCDKLGQVSYGDKLTPPLNFWSCPHLFYALAFNLLCHVSSVTNGTCSTTMQFKWKKLNVPSFDVAGVTIPSVENQILVAYVPSRPFLVLPFLKPLTPSST